MENLEKYVQNANVTVSYEVYSDLVKKSEELEKLKKDIVAGIYKDMKEDKCYFVDLGWFANTRNIFKDTVSLHGHKAIETKELIEQLNIELKEIGKNFFKTKIELEDLKRKSNKSWWK